MLEYYDLLNKNSLAGFLVLALLFQASPAQASSWNPGLLVNTETFQVIDDADTASDLYVRFGDALNKRLTFERTLDRFNFNDDVYISGDVNVKGTASGKTVFATESLRSSGSLVWEGAASGASLWVSTFRGAGLTDCDADGQALSWDSTTQQFVCGDDDTGAGGSTAPAQGLTAPAAGFLALSNSFSGTSMEIIGTASGRTIFANDTLASSGNLIVESLLKQGSGAITAIAAEFQTGAYVYASGASVLALDTYTDQRNGGDSRAPHILFGYQGVFDTDLFRHAASILRTTDWLVVDGSLGVGTTNPDTKLEVIGTASGRIVRAQDTLASSGSLVWEGAASGASLWVSTFRGAGLTDCDADGQALSWDSTTQQFVCGDDDTGAGGSTAPAQGLTAPAAGFLALSNSFSGTALEIMGTASGHIIHAQDKLQSSGTVVINLPGPNGTSLIANEKIQMNSGALLSGALILGEMKIPARTVADQISLSMREIANKSFLVTRSRNGTGTIMQPSLFDNGICYITANLSTTVNNMGCGTSNSSTLSHVADTEVLPHATNFATSTTSGNESGSTTTNRRWYRGSVTGFNGFFYKSRVIPIDTTLVRIFAGLHSQTTLANMMASDDPAGSRAGFAFSTARGDTNWQLSFKDGTTQNLINTGVAYTANQVYDLVIYTPGVGSPDYGTAYWEIINLTTGVKASGSTSSNLPAGATALLLGIGVETQTTVAKNFRSVFQYVENDTVRKF